HLPGCAKDISVVALHGVGRDRSRISVQEELGNKPVRRHGIGGIQVRYLIGAQRSAPYSHARQAAFEEAVEITCPEPQWCRSGGRIDLQLEIGVWRRLVVDRAWARRRAAIGIASAIAPIPIHIGARAIGDADHENPAPLVQGVLEIAANSQSAIGIEDVETDSVWTRRLLRRAISFV